MGKYFKTLDAEGKALKNASSAILDLLYNSGNKSLLNARSLSLWLTNRCNLNCYFCPIVTNSGDPKTELPITLIEDFLDKVPNLFPKLKIVSFSGGEPLLYSKFMKVFEMVKLRGYEMELFTNGVLLQNLEEVGALKEFARLYVSLHSIDFYEEVFGTSDKKVKEQVLTCLRSLNRDIKKRTFLDVALTRVNRVNDVIEFARRCGFKVNLFPVRNFKHAYNLTHEIQESIIDPQILQTMKNNKDVIDDPCIHTMRKLMALQTGNFSWSMPCTKPFESLKLDYEGNIRLCFADQPPIGKAMDVPEIFKNQVSRRILLEANRRLGVCRNCFIGKEPCFKCITPSQIAGFAKKKIIELSVHTQLD